MREYDKGMIVVYNKGMVGYEIGMIGQGMIR